MLRLRATTEWRALCWRVDDEGPYHTPQDGSDCHARLIGGDEAARRLNGRPMLSTARRSPSAGEPRPPTR
jgi:hypothetical protein